MLVIVIVLVVGPSLVLIEVSQNIGSGHWIIARGGRDVRSIHGWCEVWDLVGGREGVGWNDIGLLRAS